MFNQSYIIPSYKFNDQVVFISHQSFIQNKMVAKNIRKYINEKINFNNAITIGGEAYLIGLTNKKINYISNYTNSKSIYNDAIFNNLFYKKIIENNLIDYNDIDKLNYSDLLIINLARLNQNLIKIINNNKFKEIIIINCHHNDFWKKLKLLSNYLLISRKQFITNVNFITVNLLKFKQNPTFISLGGNCAIAYQLKKLGLRNLSYPFDWCKISINKLNRVLENNFKGFGDISLFKNSKSHILEDDEENLDNKSYIAKNEYNISFAHEIKTESDIELNKFKETINKRVERFKKLNDNNIIFIILNLENKKNDNLNVEILSKNLKMYFNTFKLIYIGMNYINETENIKYIKIHKDNWVDWQFSNLNWAGIFTEF